MCLLQDVHKHVELLNTFSFVTSTPAGVRAFITLTIYVSSL